MAHYAFLDENNIVVEVITGVNENELIEGLNPEDWYGNFRNKRCKRTSYNTINGVHLLGGIPFRGNYAGIGYYYDDQLDAFIPPKPFPSWNFNSTIFEWDPPMPMPKNTDTIYWEWNEETVSWESKTIL